jgi:hypothetical protein
MTLTKKIIYVENNLIYTLPTMMHFYNKMHGDVRIVNILNQIIQWAFLVIVVSMTLVWTNGINDNRQMGNKMSDFQ